MDAHLKAIIDQDLALLRSCREFSGRLGSCIGTGSYGFVVEYQDGSFERKVIKILDPQYVAYQFSSDQPEMHTSLLAQTASHASQEWSMAQGVGYTKSPHLMPMMNGPKRMRAEGRDIFFLVMPYLHTIEELPLIERRELQIVSILGECCDGLQVLHRRPEIVGERKNGMDALVHCDIKPNNIFYSDDPLCFMLGDYSIAQKTAVLEKNPISISSPSNPYCARGRLDNSSDIYSLGWVLYYWMCGKVHPTMQEVSERENGTLTMPASWGDNPELWDVFLKMTDPNPFRRYQRAEDARADLQQALLQHDRRLSDKIALQKYDDGKSTGQIETAEWAAAAYCLYLLVKWITGSDSIPTDGNGQFHGTIKKAIPFHGGYFKGTWEHGRPKDGTYTSPEGVKHKARWLWQEDAAEPYQNAGIQYYTGMSYLEKGEEVPFQGHFRIEWPWNTHFECDVESGRLTNGVLTLSDGTQVCKQFRYTDTANPFSGLLYAERNGNTTGAVRFTVGPEVTIECELVDNVPGAGCIFLPGSIDISYPDSRYEAALRLLVNMKNAGGHFLGKWDENGRPREGTYVYCSGKSVTGQFTYAADRQYTNAVYTGMLGDDGLPWGFGSAVFSDGETFTGEFLEGRPQRK